MAAAKKKAGPVKSKFQQMVDKLEDKGHSEESARKIAAVIGQSKYGIREMSRRSVASRKANIRRAKKG